MITILNCVFVLLPCVACMLHMHSLQLQQLPPADAGVAVELQQVMDVVYLMLAAVLVSVYKVYPSAAAPPTSKSADSTSTSASSSSSLQASAAPVSTYNKHTHSTVLNGLLSGVLFPVLLQHLHRMLLIRTHASTPTPAHAALSAAVLEYRWLPYLVLFYLMLPHKCSSSSSSSSSSGSMRHVGRRPTQTTISCTVLCVMGAICVNILHLHVLWVLVLIACMICLSHSNIRKHTSVFEEALFVMAIGYMLYHVLYTLDWGQESGDRVSDGVCTTTTSHAKYDMHDDAAAAAAAAAGTKPMPFKVKIIFSICNMFLAFWKLISGTFSHIFATLAIGTHVDAWASATGLGTAKLCLAGVSANSLYGISTALNVAEIGVLCCSVYTVFVSAATAYKACIPRYVMFITHIAFLGCTIHAIGIYLHIGVIKWVAQYLLADNYARLGLCAIWLVWIGVSILLASYSHTYLQWQQTSSRKIFHYIAVAMFVPPLLGTRCYCPDADFAPFVVLAMGVCLCVFIFLEILRTTVEVPILGPTMNAYYQKFVDQKKVLVLDHISLLVGCAGSVWFFASLVESTANAPIREITSASSGASGGSRVSHNSHSFILGVLFVGIGDAAGAVVGSSYGKWKWSKHSGRTIEGSIAAFLFMVLGSLYVDWRAARSATATAATAAAAAANVTFTTVSANGWAALISSMVVTLIEAHTYDNDNLVLSLCGLLLYGTFQLLLT